MTRCLPALLILLSTAGTAVSATEPDGEPAAPTSAERLIVDLSAADYTAREAAMTALMEHPELDDDLLRAAFRAAPTPEARHRLMRIALHHYYRHLDPPQKTVSANVEVRAGMGIGLEGGPARIIRPIQNPLLPNPGMLITTTMPGFPAYAHLRAGDIVVGVGDKLFDENLDDTRFIQEINKGDDPANPNGRAPGDMITLQVLRDQQIIPISFELDSIRRLAAVYDAPDGRSEHWAMNRPDFQRYLRSLADPGSAMSIRIPAPALEVAVKVGESVSADEPRSAIGRSRSAAEQVQ